MMNPGETGDNDARVGIQPSQRGQSPYKFSPEELRVMRECNKESFYKRCIPLSTALGVATYFGVSAGYIKPSAKFGATPKVSIAVIVGYFIGKFSYQQKCAEKLMQLPNSEIGEMLRQRRRGNFKESVEPGLGPSLAMAPFSGFGSAEQYTDIEPDRNPTHDIDTQRPQNDGLDDSQRPSVDTPIYEEEMPPVQNESTSYEELRKKNRDEFASKRISSYKEISAPANTDPLTIFDTPSLSSSRSSPGRHSTNKYGDEMD